MSGCDYLPSIKGMGVKKCVDFMNKLNNSSNIINKLKINPLFKDKVPKDYDEII